VGDVVSDEVTMVAGPTCPECQQNKHGNCNRDALDEATDEIVACACFEQGHDVPVGTAVLGEVSECNGLCHTEVDYPDFDNDCPVHGGEREICPEGCGVQLVDEVHDEQIGFEERARPVIVTRLACEHEIVVETTWRHVENVWTGGLL
jgi:hypothetical protein